MQRPDLNMLKAWSSRVSFSVQWMMKPPVYGLPRSFPSHRSRWSLRCMPAKTPSHKIPTWPAGRTYMPRASCVVRSWNTPTWWCAGCHPLHTTILGIAGVSDKSLKFLSDSVRHFPKIVHLQLAGQSKVEICRLAFFHTFLMKYNPS